MSYEDEGMSMESEPMPWWLVAMFVLYVIVALGMVGVMLAQL